MTNPNTRPRSPEQDGHLKRTAIALVSQMPDDIDDAHRVLDHARDLLLTFLRPEGPHTPRVVSLTKPATEGVR